MTRMKRVCIIGAGPAGLVGAKVLLKTGHFDVTVYEKSSKIGGIWAIDQETKNGWLSADTPTNLSKFSVSFSDFAWRGHLFCAESSVQQSNGAEETHVPMFPKAWHVNRYLEAYRRENIPDEMIMLNHEVVKTQRLVRATGSEPPGWKVTVRDQHDNETTSEFDLLLIASGFFSQARPLQHDIPGLSEKHHSLPVKTVHSSTVRDLKDILPDPLHAKGNTILMIGGGNSAGETAGTIAQHLSNSVYSPNIPAEKQYAKFKIVHVTPRPLYCLPPYHPIDGDCRNFIPLDFRFYDLSKRPPEPIVAGAGRQPQALKDIMHGALQGVVAGNQADLGSTALTIPTAEPRNAVAVALTESYPEFVRSGLIEAIRGRVAALDVARDESVTATVDSTEGHVKVNGVAAVVYATGFTPASALGFLPDEVKKALDYDPRSMRLPLILDGWQTMTKSVPDLALLGFYEGPYWGVMEMQARFTAARWLGDTKDSARPYEEAETLRDLRRAMYERELDVPQYWFGDYTGYLEEMAAHLGLQRNDGSFQEREGCTSPARYLSSDSNKLQADTIMKELYEVWQACEKDGKFVPRAAFRALQGNWTIHRTIDSALDSFPSGTLKGTASFHPRFPTTDKSGLLFDLEYLYTEEGTLEMSNGASMPAKRRYVYRYSEAEDRMSVWFVKPDHDLEVDYLFHNLAFATPEEAIKEGACVAKADHLCVDDMYWTRYRLPIKGIALHGFETRHTVKGPSKDYVATTRYSRPSQDGWSPSGR